MWSKWNTTNTNYSLKMTVELNHHLISLACFMTVITGVSDFPSTPCLSSETERWNQSDELGKLSHTGSINVT